MGKPGSSSPKFSTGEGNGNPLQYLCHENPMDSTKRQKDMTPEDEPLRLEGVQYATGEERRASTSSARKNEATGSKPKGHSVADVSGGERKVRCYKDRYSIGTWDVRSMNQGKLDVVKQEMTRLNIDILGISELKWTGMVEVTNRFKELDLIDRVPEELWTEVRNIVQEVATKTIPKKKKCKKAKWLSEEALQIAEERREAKGKGERERYTQFNAEFQRIARRDKNAFLNEQCKEIEENNRIGRTRDLFKKIGDVKGTFHAKMGMIKDQNDRDLTEAEEIKKRWQDYTEELYKKELNIPDNHDHNGVVTDLEPDILECEVKWALGSLSNNKASGGDSIPAELFKILKDDAVKVLHSICQQIWKTQKWPQDWNRSVYIPIPKKGNAKECSNYRTIAIISHASKVMLKILQARLQQYVDRELPEVQAGFRRGRGTRDQIANIRWIMEKAREFQKNNYFCFIDYAKAFDCMDHNKLWQVLKE
ncbi:Craniofacial development protein 2, partial [Varanus komodoensis]